MVKQYKGEKVMCKVVFYIRAYNAENYIRQTLDSLINQTEKDIRIHIRNNGSTDNTGEIIREYANKDSRVTFQENKVNRVLEEGQEWQPYIEAEYVSFLDSDDYLDPTYVEEMYKAGKPIESSLMMYKIPTRQDMGRLKVEFEHSYEPTGPFGAKSIGEIVINTPAPAIAHAIYRATGVWHRTLPITPEDIAMSINEI
jgi:glycosyltransferase involved in cell wall biosynthesis